MSMLFLLLACYGVVFYLQQKAGWFTDPLRQRSDLLDQLFSCTFCVGFWVGLSVWLSQWLVGEVEVGPLFLFGFASGAFSYALDAGIQWLEENRPPG